jgi:hypothetical protein
VVGVRFYYERLSVLAVAVAAVAETGSASDCGDKSLQLGEFFRQSPL